MNFLAHIYLSGDDPLLMAGNFSGDFVKGRDVMARFPLRIAQGIMLHRAIDEYTDSHPVVTQSKNRLRPIYRHYSSVIVDMFYDHILAKNWQRYHTTPLPIFAQQVYKTIHHLQSQLPEQITHLMGYMSKGDWLTNYATTYGIRRALTGMARRTTHVSHMENAVDELERDYVLYETEFLNFFPDLEKYCKGFIEQL